MKMTGYEKANARRFTLILLNVVLLLGAFYPIISLDHEQLSLFTISGSLDCRYAWNDHEKLREAYNCLIGLMGLLYFGAATLHLMKLLGLLGERRRNSRFLSIMFSEASLAGTIGTPLLWYLSIRAKERYETATAAETASIIAPGVWAFVCLAITVWMILLSIRLEPTKPVFESLTGTRTEDGIMDYAAAGREDISVTLLENTTSVYEKNNLRRWLLFVITVFPLFGMLLRLMNGLTAWAVPGILRYGYTANKDILGRYERIWAWLGAIAVLVLFVTTLFHIMKMMGLLGDKCRNNKRLSEDFFILQIVALLGLAACNYMLKVDFIDGMQVLLQTVKTTSDSGKDFLVAFLAPQYEYSAFYDKSSVWNYMKSLSCWYYLWLGISVFGLIPAHRLTWTKPMIEGASPVEPQAPEPENEDPGQEPDTSEE